MKCILKRVLSIALTLSLIAVNLAIPAMAEEATISVSYTDLLSNTLPGGNGTLFFDTTPGTSNAGTGLDTPQNNYNRDYAPLEVWSAANRASLNMKGTEWARFEVDVPATGFYSVDMTYGCGVAAGADFIIRTDSTIIEAHLAKSGTNAYVFTTAEDLGYVYLEEGTNYIYVDNKSTAQVNFKGLDLYLAAEAKATVVDWIAPVESANEIADLTVKVNIATDGYKQAAISDTITFDMNIPIEGKYKVSVMGIATGSNSVSADFGADTQTATVSNDAYGYTEIGVFPLTEDAYTLTLNGFTDYSLAWVKVEYVSPYLTGVESETFCDGDTVARGTDNLTITFNGNMMDTADATLTKDGTQIPVAVDVDGAKVIVSFLETLAYETEYTLTVTGLQGVNDADALEDRTYTFTTTDEASDAGTDDVTVTNVASYREDVTIEGIVKGSTGYGIKGRKISVQNSDGETVVIATSGDNGAFTAEFTIADGTDTGVYTYTVTAEYGATETAVVSYVSEAEELRILGLFEDATTPDAVYSIFEGCADILLVPDYATDCASLANDDLFLAHFAGKDFNALSEFVPFYNKMLKLEQMNQATLGSYILSNFLNQPEVLELIGIDFEELSFLDTASEKSEFATMIAEDTLYNGASVSESLFVARIHALLKEYLHTYLGIGDAELICDSFYQDLPTVNGGQPIVIPIQVNGNKSEVTELTLTITASDPTIFTDIYYTPNKYTEERYDSNDWYSDFYDDFTRDITWLDENGQSGYYDEYDNYTAVKPVKQKMSIKGKTATITVSYPGGQEGSYFGALLLEPASIGTYELEISGKMLQAGIVYSVLPKAVTVDTTEIGGHFRDGYCAVDWRLTPDGVLTVSGTGTLGSIQDNSYRSSSFPYRNYRSIIRKVCLEGITGIGYFAFYNYQNLEEVVAPDDLNIIGVGAFSQCRNLKTVRLPDTVTTIEYDAFSNCSSLKEFYFPANLREIGADAFRYCSSLEEITIPASVTRVGYGAFTYCYELKKVTIESWFSIELWGGAHSSMGVFEYCPALESVTIGAGNSAVIPDYTFYNCSSLKEIILPDNLEVIEYVAFAYCEKLKEINLPDSVTYIGNSAFAYCESLETIEIPDSVTYIGNSAFAYCESLKSVNIPDSVTYMGTSVFLGCSSLTEAPFMKNVTEIKENNFLYCSSIRELTIPDTVSTLGTGSFAWCTGLTKINWSENLTSVAALAFQNCDGLVHLELPDNIEAVGYRSFSDCDNLTTVSLSKNTTVIGEGAFLNCPAITDVYYNGSKAEWDEMYIGKDNEALLNANIHFVIRLSYDANGGENAPEALNTDGEAVISNQVPTRFGYIFKGWATTKNSWNASYQPGDTLSLPEEGMTLYAVWTPIDMGVRIYDDGLLVSVYNAPEGSQILVACYHGDELAYIDGATVTSEQRYHIPGDFTGYDYVRVMLYEDFGSLKPLILPVEAIDSSN